MGGCGRVELWQYGRRPPLRPLLLQSNGLGARDVEALGTLAALPALEVLTLDLSLNRLRDGDCVPLSAPGPVVAQAAAVAPA